MKYLHYDLKDGKVLGVFDSSVGTIPEPSIAVGDYEWSKLSKKDLCIDLKTKSIIKKDKVLTNEEVDKLRLEAYRLEADPLFFKYQREECSKEDWLSKVNEIKKRYPKK